TSRAPDGVPGASSPVAESRNDVMTSCVGADWDRARVLGAVIAQSVSQANGLRDSRGTTRKRLLCIANIENGTVNRECASRRVGIQLRLIALVIRFFATADRMTIVFTHLVHRTGAGERRDNSSRPEPSMKVRS